MRFLILTLGVFLGSSVLAQLPEQLEETSQMENDEFLLQEIKRGGVDSSGCIDTPTFCVDRDNHRVGMGTTSPATGLEVVNRSSFTASVDMGATGSNRVFIASATVTLSNLFQKNCRTTLSGNTAVTGDTVTNLLSLSCDTPGYPSISLSSKWIAHVRWGLGWELGGGCGGFAIWATDGTSNVASAVDFNTTACSSDGEAYGATASGVFLTSRSQGTAVTFTLKVEVEVNTTADSSDNMGNSINPTWMEVTWFPE